MKKSLLLLTLLLSVASSFAGTTVSSQKMVATPSDCRFRSHEWQLDVAVAGDAGVFQGKTNGSVGGDLGINYFFTQYLGIGVDNMISGYRNEGGGLNAGTVLQGNLLLRYPICALNLAPYLMVGGGASWDTGTQGNGSVGGGFDYRFTKSIALFADCRWLYGNSTSGALSAAQPRVGVRFIF